MPVPSSRRRPLAWYSTRRRTDPITPSATLTGLSPMTSSPAVPYAASRSRRRSLALRLRPRRKVHPSGLRGAHRLVATTSSPAPAPRHVGVRRNVGRRRATIAIGRTPPPPSPHRHNRVGSTPTAWCAIADAAPEEVGEQVSVTPRHQRADVGAHRLHREPATLHARCCAVPWREHQREAAAIASNPALAVGHRALLNGFGETIWMYSTCTKRTGPIGAVGKQAASRMTRHRIRRVANASRRTAAFLSRPHSRGSRASAAVVLTGFVANHVGRHPAPQRRRVMRIVRRHDRHLNAIIGRAPRASIVATSANHATPPLAPLTPPVRLKKTPRHPASSHPAAPPADAIQQELPIVSMEGQVELLTSMLDGWWCLLVHACFAAFGMPAFRFAQWGSTTATNADDADPMRVAAGQNACRVDLEPQRTVQVHCGRLSNVPPVF